MTCCENANCRTGAILPRINLEMCPSRCKRVPLVAHTWAIRIGLCLCDARFRSVSEPSGKIQGDKAFYQFAGQDIGGCDIRLALGRSVGGMLRNHHQVAPPNH